MQFHTAENNSQYQIRSYQSGEIQINDTVYQNNLVVMADRVVTDILPDTFQELDLTSCQALLKLQPDVILLGTGEQQCFLPSKLQRFFMAAKIGVEVMSTSAACRTFQILTSENRKVAAALFLK